MNRSEYIALINKERKANKNKWVSFTENVEGTKIGIKFYNTWVQRIEFTDGLTAISDSGNMDISVKQFNEFLAQSIDNTLAKLK